MIKTHNERPCNTEEEAGFRKLLTLKISCFALSNIKSQNEQNVISWKDHIPWTVED